MVTGHEPRALVSLTRGLNRHCVPHPPPNEENDMVRRHMPCPESQISGAEKAKRNAASEGAISLREDAQSLAWVNKEDGNAALELPGGQWRSSVFL